ncbi:GFA family protein [Bermanella marisrubri]|uniref:GFA family protein n=1 Tax=Bermanella marisrubri TaxID=207949 RepID=UPI001FD340F7|nr:GFA family protein [Bermanella marisrubri]
MTFEIEGDLESFYLCHCQHCQKDTGSAFAANIFSQSAKLRWLTGEDCITSFTLEGTRHNKSFCKVCGSALPNTLTQNLLVVPAGSLDTTISVEPTAHLFTSSKADWEKDLDKIAAFKSLPS